MARVKGTSASETLGLAQGATAGVDYIWGYAGNDTINGDAGNDYLYGGYGNDTVNGGDGNDRMFGDQNNDTLNGNLGNDYMDGGANDDTLNGSDGNDTMVGNSGNDTLSGGNDNDVLTGGAGNDSLNGGAGDDRIVAGAGDDNIDGGTDTGAVNLATTFFTGGDWLSYADSSTGVNVDMQLAIGTGSTGGGTDTWTGIEHLQGSNFKDFLTASNTVSGIIDGGAGNDTINAGTATQQELMRGGLGYDVLVGAANNNDGFQAQYDMGMDRFRNFDTANATVINRDDIVVSKAMFKVTVGATGGALDATVLSTGTDLNAGFTTAVQRFFFETDTKILWADLDGVGTTYDAVAVAVLDDYTGAALTVNDFILIA